MPTTLHDSTLQISPPYPHLRSLRSLVRVQRVVRLSFCTGSSPSWYWEAILSLLPKMSSSIKQSPRNILQGRQQTMPPTMSQQTQRETTTRISRPTSHMAPLQNTKAIRIPHHLIHLEKHTTPPQNSQSIKFLHHRPTYPENRPSHQQQ